jgi:hypothetical protein
MFFCLNIKKIFLIAFKFCTLNKKLERGEMRRKSKNKHIEEMEKIPEAKTRLHFRDGYIQLLK